MGSARLGAVVDFSEKARPGVKRSQPRSCEKVGCHEAATVNVILRDPDGVLRWHACSYHAEAFQNWVQHQVRAQKCWLIETWEPSSFVS